MLELKSVIDIVRGLKWLSTLGLSELKEVKTDVNDLRPNSRLKQIVEAVEKGKNAGNNTDFIVVYHSPTGASLLLD